MSFGPTSNRNRTNTSLKSRNTIKTTYDSAWKRNPLWLPLTLATASQNTLTGLVRIEPYPSESQSTPLSLSATGGSYTVNWGDGTSNNYTTGQVANHIYSYNNNLLANTNAPCTLNAATSTVMYTNHGFQEGDVVYLYNVSGGAGVQSSVQYFAKNTTANTFQVSQILGGPTITMTTDGTATLLEYKQAIVTVTPQAGQTLTFVSTDYDGSTAYTAAYNLSAYGTYVSYMTAIAWLDMSIGFSSLTDFNICRYVPHRNLERIHFDVSVAPITRTDWSYWFANLLRLTVVQGTIPIPTTRGAVNLTGLFSGSIGLAVGPAMDTSAVTNMSYMFQYCYRLQALPSYTMSSVTTTYQMFSGCYILTDVPSHWSLPNVTDARQMFYQCYALREISSLSLPVCTKTTQMFYQCYALKAVRSITTSPLLTDCGNMFQACVSLVVAPYFDTSGVTTPGSMFTGCSMLQTAPAYNFSSATSLSNIYYQCSNLRVVGDFTTSSSNTTTSLYALTYQCSLIDHYPFMYTKNVTDFRIYTDSQYATVAPAWDMSSATNASGFGGQYAGRFRRFLAYGCKVNLDLSWQNLMGIEYMQEVFRNLGANTVATKTVTITYSLASMISPAVSKTSCGTTNGSNVITQTNTTLLANGMLVTGFGVSTNVGVTFTDAGDFVTRTAHGLSNNHIISFDTITNTTGINVFTLYYVANATTDTFQVSNTANGTVLALTTDGSGTMLYGSYITNITTNTSFTLDKPASATGTVTLTSRVLDTSVATMKNWSITF